MSNQHSCPESSSSVNRGGNHRRRSSPVHQGGHGFAGDARRSRNPGVPGPHRPALRREHVRHLFHELEIAPPVHHLGIGSGSHGAQTGRMLEAIEGDLLRERPDWVLVYGDANSTLAGALAAAKLHLRVAHVEAGLRSFNRRMPEEINRVLSDHASDRLFVRTVAAGDNLRRDGIAESHIRLVGDVMYDAAFFYGARADEWSGVLERLDLVPKSYMLGTIHRAVNMDDPARLRAIFEAMLLASDELPVILPLHPRTRKALERQGALGRASRCLRFPDPVGYLDMVRLERNARLIGTDSGGVQKEAFFYRVPCVTLRDETEWVELVALGWNRVVPPVSAWAVYEGIRTGLDVGGKEGNPYGDGAAGQQILVDLQGGGSVGSEITGRPAVGL